MIFSAAAFVTPIEVLTELSMKNNHLECVEKKPVHCLESGSFIENLSREELELVLANADSFGLSPLEVLSVADRCISLLPEKRQNKDQFPAKYRFC